MSNQRLTAAIRFWTAPLIALFVVFVLAEVALQGNQLQRIEVIYSDAWHRFSGPRFEPKHVIIAAVDEQSLSANRDIPLVFWGPLFAQASKVLRQAGATVVGIDFLLSTSPETWLRKNNPAKSDTQDYDLTWRQEIASGALVVVAASFRDSSGYDQLLLPSLDYLLALPNVDAASHVGIANLASDQDDNVRGYFMTSPLKLSPALDNSETPRISFAPLLAIHGSGQKASAQGWTFGGQRFSRNDGNRAITYAGPPGTVPRISFQRLLQANALHDPAVQAVKGKVVIVGAEYLGSNDIHFTPYGSGFFGQPGKLMTGPEVQANTVETLLSGSFMEPVRTEYRILLLLLLLAIGTWTFYRLNLQRGAAVLVALLVITALVGLASFRHYATFPVGHVQAALMVLFVTAFVIRFRGETRARERMRKLFSKYVSASVVEKLVRSDELPDLRGETVEVSVLFSDIRNFTTISERLSAHEVVEMLNAYFEKACIPLLAEGGSIDKFIGDAVMVEFGAPVKQTDHALRALRAALALEQVAREINLWMAQRFAGRGLPEFHIGVGVHTGEVVMGNIGSSQRMEYTAIGDTVNVASRLEGVTKALGCVIAASQRTIEAAGEAVITGKQEKVQVKGREVPLEVFAVIGLR